MIVKDEAHVIGSTLRHLMDVIKFSYWVICDTGSTDDTKKIIVEFFEQRGIKGQLLDHEWRDFGYNRTLALQAAFNKADYLLVFDADDSIQGTFTMPTKLTHDFYKLRFGSPEFTYYRPLLLTGRKRTKFVGVLHEFLALENGNPTEASVDGDYHVISGKTGARSRDVDKYWKDAQLLEKAFQLEKDANLQSRYAFYCAQSYRDCGRLDESVTWYDKVVKHPNSWTQEKYYACLSMGQSLLKNQDSLGAVRSWLQAFHFDSERVECVALASEWLHNAGMHSVVLLLFEQHKNYKVDPTAKLFLHRELYHGILEFNTIHSALAIASVVPTSQTGPLYDIVYFCIKRILLNKEAPNEIKKYAFEQLPLRVAELLRDKDTLALFFHLSEYLTVPKEHSKLVVIWNLLFPRNRDRITAPNSWRPAPTKQHKESRVLLTFTTGKRWELFSQTVNSILSTWMDLDLVDEWFVVDDQSSAADRHRMRKNYPWVTFLYKTDTDKKSTDLIIEKLVREKFKYWVHTEDDFVFHVKKDYLGDSIRFLELQHKIQSPIKQILFNRAFADSVHQNSLRTLNEVAGCTGFCLPETNGTTLSVGSAPGMVDVEVFKGVDNTEISEEEYVRIWKKENFHTAFFDLLSCQRIGKTTTKTVCRNS